jgi:hypothetical protein
MKNNSLKWLKLKKKEPESPKIYRKNYPKTKKNYLKLKNDEKLQKITYKINISVSGSSSPGFVYLRTSHRIQGRKDVMSSKSGPC